jgi:interferon gamma-inducible protein 30
MQASGVPAILDLRLWPYGNARENPDKSFTCQHGAPECKGNMIEACGQYFYNSTDKWFPWILCLEKGNPPNDGQKCATSLSYDWNKINGQCVNDKTVSYNVMHAIAVQTSKLSPTKQYVPWVVLNGKPLYQSFNNILAKICAAYTGTKPSGCPRVEDELGLCMADDQ